MKNIKLVLSTVALVVTSCFAYSASAAPLPAGWTCTGNCGMNTAADGDVPLPPGLGSYQWISTNGGPDGAGMLPVGPTGDETNGSGAHTPTFTVNAGDKLKFFFDYITSDGAQFTEYAWAGLFSGASTFDSYLFTARTTTSGDTVPGNGLPGLGAGVTLVPPTTAIIPGATHFSPLGSSSGSCFAGLAKVAATPAGSRWTYVYHGRDLLVGLRCHECAGYSLRHCVCHCRCVDQRRADRYGPRTRFPRSSGHRSGRFGCDAPAQGLTAKFLLLTAAPAAVFVRSPDPFPVLGPL